MIIASGKGGIMASVIADSISREGVRITTFELEYPRFIHSEFMTHRMLSKNAASSRAIPVPKMIEHIKEHTAMPIHWGKNQPGMSAKEECEAPVEWWQAPNEETAKGTSREDAWNKARNNAIYMAQCFHKAGYHKQIVNRLLEPFTFMKVVCTGTEFANFFNLRCHPDAQPEIQELANCMKSAYDIGTNKVQKLEAGEWHVPYFGEGFYAVRGEGADWCRGYTLQDALMISASCCAQVSYRKQDDSIEKARDIYKRLVESKPIHASPFEHQATPMQYDRLAKMKMMHESVNDSTDWSTWEQGVTHVTPDNALWSGNLRDWIQHRQLIPEHVVW